MARSTKPNQKYRLNPNQIVAPVVPAVLDKLLQYVTVPHMYDNKGYSLDLSQAIKTLESKHLNANPVKLGMNDADPKYKNCRNLQVIGSRPKQGCPVPVGSSVTVKYITQDVINESARLFSISQKNKRLKLRSQGKRQVAIVKLQETGAEIKQKVATAFPRKKVESMKKEDKNE